MKLPDIIDEQDLARLLSQEGEIVEAAGADPAAEIHVNANEMAAAIHDYLGSVYSQLSDLGQEPAAADAAELMDYALQLQAHHLDMLDRLAPA